MAWPQVKWHTMPKEQRSQGRLSAPARFAMVAAEFNEGKLRHHANFMVLRGFRLGKHTRCSLALPSC
jgi:hypothetical protein